MKKIYFLQSKSFQIHVGKKENCRMRKAPMKSCIAFLLLLSCFSLGLSALFLLDGIHKAKFNANSRISTNVEKIHNASHSTVETKRKQQRACNEQDLSLNGPLQIDFNKMEEAFDAMNSTQNGSFGEFGKSVFEPTKCKATLSVAIIVPFRDRDQHLRRLLGHLHSILSRQHLRYQMFVVEQLGNDIFNKGRLMNTGCQYASNASGVNFDCYIFHDVDMLLENDKNIYKCFPNSKDILHLSCAVDKFRYHALCCGMTVGGVLSFSKEQFQQVNGFSNSYWGWGGEDNDTNQRIKKKGFCVQRPHYDTCRYTMIPHERDKLNPYNQTNVDSKVDDVIDFDVDGINSLQTNVVSVHRMPLFVKLSVDIGHP